MVFWELYVADASCREFESTNCWAVVDVVWVHRQEVLEGVPLNASRLLTAVRHHVARLRVRSGRAIVHLTLLQVFKID